MLFAKTGRKYKFFSLLSALITEMMVSALEHVQRFILFFYLKTEYPGPNYSRP